MLSGSTDLNEMALGNCTSACSVWGAVGGVPVLGVKDAYGNTVLSVLEGFRQGTPLPFANLDAEFLDAVDTGDCVSDCARILNMDGHWVFVYRDAAGGGVVRISPTSDDRTDPSILLTEAPKCPTVTVEAKECGRYLDEDNPSIMIMKFILVTTYVGLRWQRHKVHSPTAGDSLPPHPTGVFAYISTRRESMGHGW